MKPHTKTAAQRAPSDPHGIGALCHRTKHHVDAHDRIRYTTYGLQVVNSADNIRFSFCDISTSRDLASRFIQTLESHNVAGAHIRDMMEDMLAW